MALKSVTVFCGSSPGRRESYRQAAGNLGRHLAQSGIELVYGGGDIGLMGLLADAAIAAGGRVVGVIPRRLYDREVAHMGCAELITVETMEERKAIMISRSDAFVAMPGGLGTYDEIFEVLTGYQLGFHVKPTGLLNLEGFFDGFIEQIQHMKDEGFLRDEPHHLFTVSTSSADLIEKLEAIRAANLKLGNE